MKRSYHFRFFSRILGRKTLEVVIGVLSSSIFDKGGLIIFFLKETSLPLFLRVCLCVIVVMGFIIRPVQRQKTQGLVKLAACLFAQVAKQLSGRRLQFVAATGGVGRGAFRPSLLTVKPYPVDSN